MYLISSSKTKQKCLTSNIYVAMVAIQFSAGLEGKIIMVYLIK